MSDRVANAADNQTKPLSDTKPLLLRLEHNLRFSDDDLENLSPESEHAP